MQQLSNIYWVIRSFIIYLFIYSILFSEMKNIICPLFYLFLDR